MNDTELKELLDYCQSDSKVCPLPNYWHRAWKQLDKNEFTKIDEKDFPPGILILGGWHDSDLKKRKHFLVQIYWSYKHNCFDKLSKYLMKLEDSDWHSPNYLDDTDRKTPDSEYFNVDDIRGLYELCKRQGYV